jgi:putative two-component system response regulator
MTSSRSYRSSLTQKEVREEIEKNTGRQFDPEVAQKMLEIIDADVDYLLREKTEEEN